MKTPSLCGDGNTCDYKNDICKKYEPYGPGTCLNKNKVINNRPELLKSDKMAIFKLSVTNPRGTNGEPSPRDKRCDLDKNMNIKPHDLPPETQE